MIEAFGLFWLRPWFLLLLPAALVLGAVIVHRNRGLGAWERAMDPDLLAAMRRMGRVTGGAPRRAWVPALIIAGLGVALAGPAIERRDTAGFRNLDAVVLVLDLSPSVTADPRFFDLLTSARLLVDAAGTRQVGLIVHAGEAYVAAPLTTDARALDGTLALIDAETIPVAGTNPAAGLAMAARMLADAQIVAADVVLIGDGAGLDAAAQGTAQDLARAGAPVSALSLRVTPELVALAAAGGGQVASVTDPSSVVDRIAARAVTRLAETDYAMLVLRDLGRWLVLLALVPALFVLPRWGRA